MPSRPTRARELKRLLLALFILALLSRPTRARELKPPYNSRKHRAKQSRPTRARELKPKAKRDHPHRLGRAPRGRVN